MHSRKLRKHLVTEHKISYLSGYLREIVYGGNDGIVTTFAVVAGFAGAQAQVQSIPLFTVLLFGFANLFADGVSMALGSFLSSRSSQDVYRHEENQESAEMQTNIQSEEDETIDILISKGFSVEQARELTTIYKSNTKFWLEFHMTQELGIPNPTIENPLIMSLTTFCSFVSFGMIPLIPYILLPATADLFLFSCLAVIGAMILLGIFRFYVTRQQLLRSVLENLILGGTAAFAAYVVGSFFRL